MEFARDPREQSREEPAPVVQSAGFDNELANARGPQSEILSASGPIIKKVDGDLLTQDVDVIVNAWNRNCIPYWLLVRQGISGAIKRAGGNGPFAELGLCKPIPLGEARLTSAGSILKFKGIIHVAGINLLWRSSDYSVRESVKSALEIAKEKGFASIAFPAIGAGSSVTADFAVWGVSTNRSLALIEDQVKKSDYSGKVVIVRYKRGAAES